MAIPAARRKKLSASVARYHGMPSDFYNRLAFFLSGGPVSERSNTRLRSGYPPQLVAVILTNEFGMNRCQA
jgi:hypothetical protein